MGLRRRVQHTPQNCITPLCRLFLAKITLLLASHRQSLQCPSQGGKIRGGAMARNRRGKPQHQSLLVVHTWLTGDKPPNYHFDLTLEEFASIGLVTVQWSYLEYALYMRTKAMAKRTRTTIPQDATNLSFTRRLRAFGELVEQALKRKPAKAYYKALIPQIARAAGDRQRVTHHLWTYNPRNPSQLWVTRASSLLKN